jgi:DNA repair protein RadA/Sms
MARSVAEFVCSDCGGRHLRWSGQCSDCGAWNTLQETVSESRVGRKGGRFEGYAGSAETKVVSLDQVEGSEATRTPTGMGELDRVLGGGLVAGSVVLVGGDPGIGKSTILLQTLAGLGNRLSALYVSGEESPQQVSLRARRLGLAREKLRLLPETCVERILALVRREALGVMVVDSIQTLFTEVLQSAPGSVAQVRESAAQLVRYAKLSGTAVILVGHVTKEGQIAGPRVLEHMVDTVLYFEGDSGGRYRVMRAVKNRFGPVNELGVFAMTEGGLKPVNNPSAIFLSQHQEPVPGTVILVTREGTRPLLVEIQVLVDGSQLANPRRVTLGVEQNRLSMLLAVLHRHGGVSMFDQDVFVNAVGGMRISETAADLPVLLAVLSSFRDRPLPARMAAFGEVGLAGEIRPVPNGEERLREAAKQGFTQLVIPHANAPRRREAIEGLEVHPVKRIEEALELLRG